ncbi:MAG: tRNA (adenosine(37)-N6)-threonylcarbamoyltransferase complex dimerization subunit type 1 TsaB [Bacteroidales bacterium]|nr:tRNA (adenosine(37)-N6)-threonylcarbamoyltransferase complex dimerization subunit type 1 TsaB [Bacteroidales bacterium]
MAKILLIETSTALCSAAVEIDGKVVASRRDASRQHASLAAVFCDEVLREAGLKAGDLDAVCISDGPGSYTGLRVGLSTAKGLCFGSGAKMLSVSSLDVLAAMARNGSGLLPAKPLAAPGLTEGEGPAAKQWEGPIASQSGFCGKTPAKCSAIVPMIDARRMEVFTAEYDPQGNRLSGIEAKVIDAETIREPLKGGHAIADIAAEAVFIGDGALKCKDVIGKGTFIEALPDAATMAELAEKEYAAENFRDVAYFEPFYLKDYIPTVSIHHL